MELSFTKNKKYIQQRPENENITKNKNKNHGTYFRVNLLKYGGQNGHLLNYLHNKNF